MFQITTVDKYQGQQNDYILLSLVRTKTVGHIRDVRRLVVAVSRARLGLYMFARVSLFQNCFELSSTFKLLTQRPLQLHLFPHENYSTKRELSDKPSKEESFIIEDMPNMVQFVYQFYQKKIEEWKRDKPEIFEQFVESKSDEKTDQVLETQSAENMIVEEEQNESEFAFEKLTEDDDGNADIEQIDIDLSDEKQ